MVRFKVRFWFFLLIFGLYLSCPGYPEVKGINIKNLPANQDMDRVEKDYGSSPLDLEVTDADGNCIGSGLGSCLELLQDTAKCNECVSLEEKCPGCCLGENATTGEQEVLCPELDASGKHVCGAEAFYETNCGLEDCEDKSNNTSCYDNENCRIKCSDHSYKSGSKCEGTVGTGGGLESTCSGKKTYGLQRAGCPNKDSDLLAPNDEDCTLVSGTKDLDRKWKCKVTGIIPKFAEEYVNKSLCSPDPSLTFIYKPDSSWGYGDYYAVTEVSPICPADTCTNSCKSKCKITSSGRSCCSSNSCGAGADSCTPLSCTPECPDKVCNYNCVSNTACLTADESTNDCVCAASGPCNPSSCNPTCDSDDACDGKSRSCEGDVCESVCSPDSDTYYVYVLSDKYKKHIEECIKQADEYEKCVNELDCCRDGVCPKKTNDDGCDPGFDTNCDLDKCEKLACYYSDCESYIGDEKTESCADLASAANDCMSEHKECFQEIEPEDIKYDFAARRGDSLTIIWQMNVKSSNDAEGVNFYTLVKVFELDEDKNPVPTPAHTSMMNVRNLESNFTIFGATNIRADSGELEAGKFYRAKLYYFLPNAEFCDANKGCEVCAAVSEAEVSYISLTLVKARE